MDICVKGCGEGDGRIARYYDQVPHQGWRRVVKNRGPFCGHGTRTAEGQAYAAGLVDAHRLLTVDLGNFFTLLRDDQYAPASAVHLDDMHTGGVFGGASHFLDQRFATCTLLALQFYRC